MASMSSSVRPDPAKRTALILGRVDLGQALKTSLLHPSALLGLMTLDIRLSKALCVSQSQLKEWRHRLIDVARLPEQVATRYHALVHSTLGSSSTGGTVGPTNEVLYIIVRALRPGIIVETGVAHGFSSAYLLQALSDNGFGELISIDLPTTNPTGRVNEDGIVDQVRVASPDQTGMVVPPPLRNRWTLYRGNSKDLLPKVIASHSPIDIFFHDSSHSYQNMLWEYQLAWPHIRPGGWLLSDDINWNSAFNDFSREVKCRPFTWERRHRGGLIHP
jgi:hypothetical protein